MSDTNVDISAGRIFWYRWVPPAILLFGAWLPAGYMIFFYTVMQELSPKYWDFGQLMVSIFLSIIAVVARFFPFTGGIFAILVIPVIILGYALMAGLSGILSLVVNLFIIFFGIGGISSIVCGIYEWLRRRRKSGQV
jgi:hypothetical protein